MSQLPQIHIGMVLSLWRHIRTTDFGEIHGPGGPLQGGQKHPHQSIERTLRFLDEVGKHGPDLKLPTLSI
jgi:hypothetical protein